MNISLTILFFASLIFQFYGVNTNQGDFAGRPENSSAAQAAAEKSPMFVLQIGISNYKFQRKLSGVEDVLEMRKLLTGEAYQVPRENIRTLCDDGTVKECDGAATKENIIREFETHLIAKASAYKKRAGGQAIVVFEFSGHGSQAPDQNGDEQDNEDETLVTWNSRDKPGENLDISDDEIYALTKKLSPSTDNIVYILDSCNSGSGTRGSDDARSVPARQNPVVPVKAAAQVSRGETAVTEKKIETDVAQTDLLPPSNNYIVISAAEAGHLALQKDVFDCETCEGAKKIGTYGILTYYLMEELRNATAATSYRDVMENVRRKVSAERPTQNPQIEGNDNRLVFQGLSKVKTPGVKISEVRGKQIFIAAGAMQGISVGTIIDVYSLTDEKIGTAKISEVAADKSAADVIEIKSADGVVVSPKRAISAERKDRAVVVAPDLGATRIKFLPDGDDAAKLTVGDKRLIASLRRAFTPEKGKSNESGIDLAVGRWNDAGARWDVALLKDRFDKVFPDRSRVAPIEKSDGTDGEFPAGEKQIFYLAGKDFVPLYGFYVEAERANAGELIEKAVVQISRLRAVRAIANNKSRLKGLVTIKPFRFTYSTGAPCDEKDNIKMLGKTFVPFDANSKTYKFDLGEIFGLEITNTSDKDLYITVLDIATDGSVQILSPLPIDPEKEKGVLLAAKTGKKIVPEKCVDSIRQTSAPSGIETFKVIATTAKTKREDFEFLEMSGINTQRTGQISLASLADWTTAEVDFQISSMEKKPQ